MNKETPQIEVAQIGRLVGLRGELKLHNHSDFPEQFKAGASFSTDKNKILKIQAYNKKRELVMFEGYESRESAAALVNSFLLTTLEQTMQDCSLQDDELFWFDIIGATVLQDELVLGTVADIERIGVVDYLSISTDALLVDKGLSKTFYLPFIDRYIQSASREDRSVYVKDGLGILENS